MNTAPPASLPTQPSTNKGISMTGFVLGRRSLAELEGVHPALVAVVRRAITLSPQDFAVHDGLRTRAEQEEYLRRGVSQTMASKHLPQTDGHGHAVDLVPLINGKLRWEWPPIYEIAAAVKQAAALERVAIRWGGCWRDLAGIEPGPVAMREAVENYGAARRQQGRKAFTDGPHFELLA
jgi:peptidoglycan L-alanyl-D-glutamate endopeptidase CwlK